MFAIKNIKIDKRIKYLIGLMIICILHIFFFTNLSYIYDWDTITRAIWLKEGLFARDAYITHFLISILGGTLVYFGIDPLDSFKIFTGLFMFILIIVTYEFAYKESNDEFLAFLFGIFLLSNFGYTFLLTTIEDNIWLEGCLILFIYFLFLERWAISALFLSLSILMHIQGEVFIPMFLLYAGGKLNLSSFSGIEGMRRKICVAFSTSQINKLIVALFFLFAPILAACSYLHFKRGWVLSTFIEGFTASASCYHGDSGLWFFASDRTIQEELKLTYYGYLSAFVCKAPEFFQSMPKAPFLGIILAILILYLLVVSFSLNLKTICALPTFIVLMLHVIVYEPWNVERWDFFPLFIVYFIAVGYSTKSERAKNSIKLALALLVIFSSMFTFASFNSLCGLQESSICAYGDKLGTLLDNKSIAFESTLNPDSSYGRYLKYQCGDRIIFSDSKSRNINDFAGIKIYTSNSSFESISKIFPRIFWEKEKIWSNGIDQKLSIILIKPYISY
ncbi:MAG: hypothetical protein A4E49_00491 [Methanosaeta sp. PtaU1.Bin112]|nr:MAG: hypothetical protein A4E49_00491 [Methanosaeta sp. PtaU1.Bin112]